MTTPKLSLNERLAIAFGGWKINQHDYLECPDGETWYSPEDYENDSIAAFSLLEKVKQDGKISGYELSSYEENIWKGSSWGACCECKIWIGNLEEVHCSAENKSLSKAITQALAQLLTEDK